MKKLLFILATFIFFSCSQAEKKTKPQNTNTHLLTTEEYKRDSIYNFLFQKDSVVFVNMYGDTTVLTKKELNYLEENYSGLFASEYPLDPDLVFNQRKIPQTDTIFLGFSSEAGQDAFYNLYAYFLSIRNGIDKYIHERKNIVDIYEAINNIHTEINGAGTFYLHMDQRILAYAEYAVTLYGLQQTENAALKFDKQKQLFLQALQQDCEDRIELNKEATTEEKQKQKSKILELIHTLNGKINSYFYLSMARQFEYSKYN
ncbi:MAG: hypothetical protein JSR09_01505 [Bacteroidetes bacterium]|nr:hypothetical protein [Bacteroidota bacterium]MBS1648356.1 hypothetical protein [Bacteroidota bacterium]